MSYAIRYATTTGAEHVLISGNREETRIKVGSIIWAAHCRKVTLAYVRIVACRKRPGTKALLDMSRQAMSEDALRKCCKYFHRAYVASK